MFQGGFCDTRINGFKGFTMISPKKLQNIRRRSPEEVSNSDSTFQGSLAAESMTKR